jgi:hypothetical protein
MSGKKSDPIWQPDAVLKLAEDRFISSVEALQKAAPAAVLALASDLVYEAAYQLTWWQWLFFPILSRRLHLEQRELRQCGALDHQNRNVMRRTVAQLEFGEKPPPAHIVRLVRENIVQNEFSNWQVRQAFNSFALFARKGRYLRRTQPSKIHGMSVLAHWCFALVSGLLLAAMMVETFIAPILPMSYNQVFVLFEACVIAAYAFYQLGYQWRHGEYVMQNIWPSPVVHSSI